ncbi:MAG TPA: glycosyltransferase family 39 protein [Actinomycetales bacterium]
MATAPPTRYTGSADAADRAEPVPATGSYARLTSWRPTRHGDAVVLLPLLLLAAALLTRGLAAAPARSQAEGSLVRQAWAVLHLGDLTYPGAHAAAPFGWWQLAAWTGLTGRWAPDDILSGRRLMVVLTLVSAVLLWVLAKRLALPRWAAALAVALLVASPAALLLHRTVLVDTIAMTWVLASFVLALDPARRIGAFVAAMVALALATLSSLSSLLLLPAVGWVLWRRSHGTTRQDLMPLAASLSALVGGLLAVLATRGGEVLITADGAGGLAATLNQVLSSDTSARTGSGADSTLALIALDPVLSVVILVATLVGLLIARLRPIAAGALVLMAVLLVPFRTPGPLVALLPIGALLVAGVAHSAWEHRRRRAGTRLTGLLVATAVVLSAFALPGWATQLRSLTASEPGRPMREATAWIGANVPQQARVLTDDALWTDLVEQGRPRGRVVGFADPGELPGAATDWRAYQWVVSTPAGRLDAPTLGTLDRALGSSRAVASFGAGDDRVEVRQVVLGGVAAPAPVSERPAPSEQPEPQQPAPSTPPPTPPGRVLLPTPEPVAEASDVVGEAGRQLVSNPRLTFSPQARAAITSGRVDPRLLTVLALVAAGHDVQVQALSRSAGGTTSDGALDTLRVTAVDGGPVSLAAPGVREVVELLRSQRADYRPTTRVLADEDPPALEVTFATSGS